MSTAQKRTTREVPCLRAAISRTLSGYRPDDDDLVDGYADTLKKYWQMVFLRYIQGFVIKSVCTKTGVMTSLHPHNQDGMGEIFANEAIEGRAFLMLSRCGKKRRWVKPSVH